MLAAQHDDDEHFLNQPELIFFHSFQWSHLIQIILLNINHLFAHG